jgi:Spy/CpxP family protein refolding chaperone
MMKIHARYFVAAMLAAAPVTAAAQTTAPPQAGEHHGAHGQMHGRRGPGGPGHTPIQGILSQRQQLGLSAEQVSRLEAIDRDLQARNEPLHQQLHALMPEDPRAAAHREGPPAQGERRQPPQGGQAHGGGQHGHGEHGDHPQLTAEQRQRMERIHEQARPLMEQVHQNFQAAMEQVHTVLTPEQQQRARQAMGHHGGPGHHGPGGEHGQRGARPRQGGRAPR